MNKEVASRAREKSGFLVQIKTNRERPSLGGWAPHLGPLAHHSPKGKAEQEKTGDGWGKCKGIEGYGHGTGLTHRQATKKKAWDWD